MQLLLQALQDICRYMKILKFIYEGKDIRLAKTIWKKQNKVGDITQPVIKAYSNSYNIQDYVAMTKEQTYRPMERNSEPRNRLIFHRSAKAIWWRKDGFFNKRCQSKWVSVGKTGEKEKSELDPNLTIYRKITSKCTSDLNIKYKL